MTALANSAAVTRTAAESFGEEFAATPVTAMLWALKSAYANLEHCIAQMEVATSRSRPDMASLANARFRISRASLAKRQLLQTTCEHLLRFATPDEAAAVRALQRDSIAYGAASTEHIRRWPAAEVDRNWSAYREASRQIRARIKQVMRSEQRLLFPLLARYEQR